MRHALSAVELPYPAEPSSLDVLPPNICHFPSLSDPSPPNSCHFPSLSDP